MTPKEKTKKHPYVWFKTCWLCFPFTKEGLPLKVLLILCIFLSPNIEVAHSSYRPSLCSSSQSLQRVLKVDSISYNRTHTRRRRAARKGFINSSCGLQFSDSITRTARNDNKIIIIISTDGWINCV